MSDIIVFLNQKFYWPGALVKGKVVLCLTKAKVIKAISVRVNGESSLRHRSSHNSLAESSGESGEQRKLILDSSFPVLGGADTKAVELKAGKHEMRFEFKLPEDVPGSINLPDIAGTIQYHATATLEAAAAFSSNKKTSAPAPFRVVEPSFLKHFDAEYTRGHKELTEKEYHSGWQVKTVTGRLTSILELKKRHFVPGEQVFMNILLENQTPDTFEAIQLQVVQVEQYSLAQNLEQETQGVEVKKVVVPLRTLKPGESRHFGAAIGIPDSCPPTTTTIYQRDIRIGYRLLVRLAEATDALHNVSLLLLAWAPESSS